ALRQALKAMEIAEGISEKAQMKDVYLLLSEIYERKGRHLEALKYYKQFTDIRHDLLNKGNLRKFSKLEERSAYEAQAFEDSLLAAADIQAVETRLATEEERSALQTSRLWSVGIGAAVVALLLIVVIFFYLQTRRQRDQIEVQRKKALEQDEEKAILLKEIHHRVKNNLQVVSSLLELQSFEIDDPKAQLAVEDGQSRVKAMALIHEKLYGTDTLSRINFEDYARQLLDQISSVYPGGKSVARQISTEQPTLDIDTAIPIGLIMSELITNAFKYGMINTEQGKIDIKLSKVEEGTFRLAIADNGPGLPAEFDLKNARSLGLRLVNNLARQLYGSVEYAYLNGAQFQITFKGQAARKAVD
ncbi:MAG: sensor histidine kinase, partial [Bacteroidota bacterium]